MKTIHALRKSSGIRKAGALALLALGGWVLPAAGLTYGNYECELNSDGVNTVTITDYTGPGGAIVIPATFLGIPNRTVTRIGDMAFWQNDTLTSVTIPIGIRSIGVNAFGLCSRLTSIVVEAGSPNFSGVDGVLFDAQRTTLIACPGGKSGRYVIPDTVNTLQLGAFDFCDFLTEVVIPAGLVSIPTRSFFICQGLTSIAVDPNNPGLVAVDGVLFNKARTTLLEFPKAKSGRYAIPAGTAAIEEYAFGGATGLVEIVFSDSVAQIGAMAFYACRGLTSLALPDSVVAIGTRAFLNCDGLTTATIGTGLGPIGDMAFANCSALANIYFHGNAPTLLGTDVFDGSNLVVVRYLACKTGWTSPFGGRQAVPFTPAYSVTPWRREVGFAGGRTSFAIANMGAGVVKYRASETSSWMRITNGAAGTAGATIRIFCSPNRGRTARSGQVSIQVAGCAGPTRVRVIQGGRVKPLLSAAPDIKRVGSAAGQTTFAVSNKGGGRIAYRASESMPWLYFIGRRSGGNRGTLTLGYAANPGAAARTGTVAVASTGANFSPVRVKIVQAGAP